MTKYEILSCFKYIDDIYDYLYDRLNKYCDSLEIHVGKNNYIHDAFKIIIVCRKSGEFYEVTKVISIMEINLTQYEFTLILDEMISELINKLKCK